ncbi:SH3 domain-containing protein [Parvularcula lutaonensis]|uniref:SH3 domain-containing protein n=1 Tax=Parvularcula lutaonensis TaxID=491923 RepID=A0ABV7MA41_9PROT|nr:SH3 domain-containing protein [Parvularcula lutaonensis]
MRAMPQRLGLSILILALISMVSAITGSARAQDEETRTGFSGLPVPRFVALKKDVVNGRAGPSLDLDVVVIYRKKGLPVKVIAETSDNVWRRVEDHTGRRVWINRSMLAENKHALIEERTVIFAEPTEEALPRARLEPGVMAKLEMCEGDWCRVKTKDFRGWAEKQNLWGTF